jgi:hypothetical protein
MINRIVVMKPQRSSLATKAYDAYKIIQRNKHKQRADRLAGIGEFGFSILCYWNMIELHLKVMRYGDHIVDGWPDKLEYISGKWKPIKQIKEIHPKEYDLILSASSHSLWKVRNLIAHVSFQISDNEYFDYLHSAEVILRELGNMLPPQERLLAKKRNSDAQTQRRK